MFKYSNSNYEINGPNGIDNEAFISKNQTQNPLLASNKTRLYSSKTSVDSKILSELLSLVYKKVILGLSTHPIYNKYVHHVVSEHQPDTMEYVVRKSDVLVAAIMSAIRNQIASLDSKTFSTLFMHNHYAASDELFRPLTQRNIFGSDSNAILNKEARDNLFTRYIVDPAVAESKKIYISSELKDESVFKKRSMVQDSSHLRVVHSGAGSHKPTKPMLSHRLNSLGKYRNQNVAIEKKMNGMIDKQMSKYVLQNIDGAHNVSTMLSKNVQIGRAANATAYNKAMNSIVLN